MERVVLESEVHCWIDVEDGRPLLEKERERELREKVGRTLEMEANLQRKRVAKRVREEVNGQMLYWAA